MLHIKVVLSSISLSVCPWQCSNKCRVLPACGYGYVLRISTRARAKRSRRARRRRSRYSYCSCGGGFRCVRVCVCVCVRACVRACVRVCAGHHGDLLQGQHRRFRGLDEPGPNLKRVMICIELKIIVGFLFCHVVMYITLVRTDGSRPAGYNLIIMTGFNIITMK